MNKEDLLPKEMQYIIQERHAIEASKRYHIWRYEIGDIK